VIRKERLRLLRILGRSEKLDLKDYLCFIVSQARACQKCQRSDFFKYVTITASTLYRLNCLAFILLHHFVVYWFVLKRIRGHNKMILRPVFILLYIKFEAFRGYFTSQFLYFIPNNFDLTYAIHLCIARITQ